jgi:hypothetical protein
LKLVLGNELAVGILDPGALRDEFLAGLIAAFTRRTRTSCERLGKIEVLEPVGELGGADLYRVRGTSLALARDGDVLLFAGGEAGTTTEA